MCSYPTTLHSRGCLPNLQVIVFDLDDTLFSEHQYVHSGFKAVSSFLLEQGIASTDTLPLMWSLFLAGERRAVFNRALEDIGVFPEKKLLEILLTVYRSHQPDITLYPDARALLDHVYGRKQLALLSDGFQPAQKAKLAALAIQHYFNAVVLTDELGRDCWKPSPAGFEKIMQALGGNPAGYVYIGDNPVKDFAAPRTLGWQTICVRRPGGVYSESSAPDKRFEAAFQVDDLYQAGRLIDPDWAAP